MSPWRRLARWRRERGLAWTVLWCVRALLDRLHRRCMAAVERPLAAIERRRFVVGPDTVSARGNTVEENRRRWTRWNWTRGGEEWTDDVARFRGTDPETWRRDLLSRFMDPHARKRGTTLEIGPGGGRWTGSLLETSACLHLVDVSSRCLEVCRERFADARIACHLVGAPDLSFLEDRSIDFVWSYDVFVHVNPMDADAYLREIARVLRPGARAVIHHADRYASARVRSEGFRSNLTAAFFAELCRRNGLDVLEQDLAHAHKPGDCISVLERPAGTGSTSYGAIAGTPAPLT